VNVESGEISAQGGEFSITNKRTWLFSTMAGAPSNRSALSVALDGSGAFCSVQGAFDLVPANNTAAVTITVGTGNYHEIIYVSGKSNVTLQGQDRNGTVISGTNNNNLNPSTRGRALFGVDNASNLTVRNLTIRNLTPQGGSQAEALRLQSCDKCVIRDATIISLQDTLLWAGRIYAANCLIEGNVDYIWGSGAAYFSNCEIRTIGPSAAPATSCSRATRRRAPATFSSTARSPPTPASPATCWRASTSASIRPATSPTSIVRCRARSPGRPGW
jgi:pectin methylesterase-like acyl-CoA thioesterase